MLVKRGYIKEPVGLYGSLQNLLPSTFFVDGKIPTTDFSGALLARIGESMQSTISREAECFTSKTPETPSIRANRLRLREVLSTNVEVHWAKPAVRIEEGDDKVTVFFEEGTSASGGVLVGADGTFSAAPPTWNSSFSWATRCSSPLGPDFALFSGVNRVDKTVGQTNHWLNTATAHPMTPTLGEGALYAIKDAVQLSKMLRESDTWGFAAPGAGLDRYQQDIVAKGYESIMLGHGSLWTGREKGRRPKRTARS
ncbi:hypothetical protein B0T24DRAFT_591963 [Lasiosphaeria ovina]|uniref:FAD-binding domain-containing protein n=1 Tax=Lasiosphaeria ovina TaxID=92902 RepID=A0AAE0NAN3_9PEZI|nr:hypothetical protein B0T24DRAFT_591963 [Lasiosphaeria ovina]